MKRKFLVTVCISLCLLLAACGGGLNDSAQQEQATDTQKKESDKEKLGGVFDVKEDEEQEQDENITNQVYSTYNLATSYLMLGEDEIALQYFLRIPQNVPNDIKYASLYNIGLIYFQKGDFSTASDYFKNAIKVDNSKLEAKLNMELSLQMIETSVLQNENNIIPATQNDSDEDSLDKKLFKHIKENEKRQWKNTEIEYEPDFSKDY